MDENTKKTLLYDAKKKSALIAYIIFLFTGFGFLGIHRFYLGSTMIGLLLIVTFIFGFVFPPLFLINGIFLIIDLFSISFIAKKKNTQLIKSLQ